MKIWINGERVRERPSALSRILWGWAFILAGMGPVVAVSVTKWGLAGLVVVLLLGLMVAMGGYLIGIGSMLTE